MAQLLTPLALSLSAEEPRRGQQRAPLGADNLLTSYLFQALDLFHHCDVLLAHLLDTRPLSVRCI